MFPGAFLMLNIWKMRVRGAGVVCLCGLMGCVAWAGSSRKVPAVHKKVVELSPFEQAVADRAAFEDSDAAGRTKAEYARVMDEFRAVYHANPRDSHAAESVFAVAELLAEQGRALHDAKSLRDAVGQYEFLRKQYPGSGLRGKALAAEKEIANAEVAPLRPSASGRDDASLKVAAGGNVGRAKAGPSASLRDDKQKGNSERKRDDKPGQVTEAVVEEKIAGPVGASSLPATAPTALSKHGGGAVAMVTGIRHWSTARYTRVAIDLGDEVEYEAARVPNPDRIYFDLHGSRLTADLLNKTFAVTDDGFLKKIRAAQAGTDVTRIVLDVSDVSEYTAFLLPNPYRLIIDIHGSKQDASPKKPEVGGGESKAPAARPSMAEVQVAKPVVMPKTVAEKVPNTVAGKSSGTELADVSRLPGKVTATTKPTSQPIVQGIGERGEGIAGASSTKKGKRGSTDTVPVRVAGAPVSAAVPTLAGETSLVRALGLKIGRIVIDAGHGGHDSGTLGAGGIEEKDVVLDVALRLGKMLHEKLGAEIIYTRADDTFIPLETRTAIANKAQADLFISIHANSSTDSSARGVETYYLNFTSQPEALQVAARENAVSNQSIHQLSDLVKKITLKDKIDESKEFAADVDQSLWAGLQQGNVGLKNRGVKKAPFVVLIGANMPSILAEISFVTNPRDASQLRQPEYKQRVAESLYKGVAKYMGGLSGGGMKLASLDAGKGGN